MAWSFTFRGGTVTWDKGNLTGDPELVAQIADFITGQPVRINLFGPAVRLRYTSEGVYAATLLLVKANGGVPSWASSPWEGDYPQDKVVGITGGCMI